MTSNMEGVEPTQTQTQKPTKPKTQKAVEIRTFTIREPQFSYAQLELISETLQKHNLDVLQVRSYCSSALGRFLGDTGMAIPIDILKVHRNQCWLRVPGPDLPAFAAAITAWPGTIDGEVTVTFRILQCSDWLGSMVGRDGQEDLWT